MGAPLLLGDRAERSHIELLGHAVPAARGRDRPSRRARTVSTNSKTAVRSELSASTSASTEIAVISAGIRSAGRPAFVERAESPSAPALTPADRCGRRPSPNCVASPPPCALPTGRVALRVKSIRLQALPAPGCPALRISVAATSSMLERQLRARPRRCGRGKAPAATRRRVLRAAARHCHCAPHPTARRSPPAGYLRNESWVCSLSHGPAVRSLSIIATASTSRSPRRRVRRRNQPGSRRPTGPVTAGWSGSDDSSTGASSPVCDRTRGGQRPGHRDGHLLGVLRPRRRGSSIASTGTSDGRRGSNKTTIIALARSSLVIAAGGTNSLYQSLAAVSLAGPSPSRPPSAPTRHRGAAARPCRRLAESEPAPWTWWRGSWRAGYIRLSRTCAESSSVIGDSRTVAADGADTSVMPEARHSNRNRATATSRCAGSGSDP